MIIICAASHSVHSSLVVNNQPDVDRRPRRDPEALRDDPRWTLDEGSRPSVDSDVCYNLTCIVFLRFGRRWDSEDL